MAGRLSPILLGLFLLLYVPAMGLVFRLVALPLCWLLPSVGVPFLNRVTRFWGVNLFRAGMLLAGVRVRVSGFEPEPGRPYLVISNHQSIVDIPLHFWLFRRTLLKFVMKKELRRGIPNVSPGTRAGHFAFLDRRAGVAEAERELTEFCRHVRAERTGAVIYPEGTRSRDGRLRPFKVAGVSILAQHLDYDVVVVTLDGTWRAATPRRLLSDLPGLEIAVRIEEPRPIEPFRTDPKAALAEVRALMERRLSELRG